MRVADVIERISIEQYHVRCGTIRDDAGISSAKGRAASIVRARSAPDPAALIGVVVGQAELHLSEVCRRFARVLPSHEPFPTQFPKSKDPYRSLVRAIVFQQLSGKAAGTIHGRVLALFPSKDHPDPQDILDASPELLRSAGLSRQKIAALKDVSSKRIEGIIPPARQLARLGDEEIIERLTAARGVGRWTAEMYLIFTLGRPDVLPIDDLGVRKGAERLYQRSFTSKELAKYGRRWAPWRSAAAWHLWRFMDTLVVPD